MAGLDCKESTYKKQQNNNIIKKLFLFLLKFFVFKLIICIFRFNENIINVLITSEVLEEGVDIQTCNYVIRYDSPKNFPSYVQSKGRARSSESKFIIMVANKLKFEKVHTEYRKMEAEIEKVIFVIFIYFYLYL